MRKHYYLRNVTTLNLNRDKCTGCGMCTMVCPHAVFEIKSQKAFMTDKDACMECGACQLNCPVEAISVNAGVGCAEAIIRGALKGTEASCDCSCESSDICC